MLEYLRYVVFSTKAILRGRLSDNETAEQNVVTANPFA